MTKKIRTCRGSIHRTRNNGRHECRPYSCLRGNFLYNRVRVFVFIILLFFAGCAGQEESTPPDYSSPVSNISVYFSPPTDLNEKLSQLIDEAKISVEGAFYSLRSPQVTQALLRASLRGVRVRLVLDDEQRFREYSAYPRLKNFHLVKTDADNRALMHNKFCIVDGRWLWTGSYNPNPGAIYENNDVVLIQSEELAAIYRKKFEQFWQGNFHSPLTETCRGLIHRTRNNESQEVRVATYFSPEGQAFEQILLELKKPRRVSTLLLLPSPIRK